MSTETLPRPLTTTPTPEVSRRFASRVWQGPAEEARWVRPALFGLLIATAFLYLWGLGSSGWANSFYSAAAQAGSESWKAFFFGSSDAGNSITVDKPPASLWVMGLSVRIFGLSSWSILVPQALIGVASVGLLYATVRRAVRSPGAGLLAGTVLALTPVAALMFRFNNPDALLVMLLIGAAASTLRAIEATWTGPRARTARGWLVLAGTLVGFAFLTKMLQAFLVLPGFALAYLMMASRQYGYLKRLRDLALALVALIVSAGWWVAIVELWPASDRPYIGGSQHNSILELIFGYNGFGRLTGDETGSVGGGAVPGGNWGATGWLRMMGDDVGGQIGWLLPPAVLVLVAGLWIAIRSRIVGATAGLVIWGGWLAVTAATFSAMQGIFHPYYTVALAPAIGAILGIGGCLLWRRRTTYSAGAAMGAVVGVATVTSFILLSRSAGFVPGLRWLVLTAGLVTALLLCGLRLLPHRLATTVAGFALVAVLAGPAAYTADTVSSPHTGSIPSAGPSAGGFSGPGGGTVPGGGFARAPRAGQQHGAPPQFGSPGGTLPGGTPPSGAGTSGAGIGAGIGGLLNGSTSSSAVNRLLESHASDYTWVAATVGSDNASGYQLATQRPVMPIGGFNGSDPSPTLAEFKTLVAEEKIHYFIASGGTGAGAGFGAGFGAPAGTSSGSNAASQITSWVEKQFASTTVGGVTLYDLSGGTR